MNTFYDGDFCMNEEEATTVAGWHGLTLDEYIKQEDIEVIHTDEETA